MMGETWERGVRNLLTIDHTVRDFEAADHCKTAILPVGAVEQHGSHLPVGTDTFIAAEMSKRLAKELDAYLLPALAITSSIEHRKGRGTVYLRSSTVSQVIRDIAESLQYSGFEKLILYNAHGGNWGLKPEVRQLNNDFEDRGQSMQVILIQSSAVMGVKQWDILEHSEHDLHGGERETSLMLYFRAETVKDIRAMGEPVNVPRDYMDYFDVTEISEDGYWGFPEAASAEKGRLLAELAVQGAVEYLRKLEEARRIWKGRC